MAQPHYVLDATPGALPEIRPHRDGITYVMTPPGTRLGQELVIRCDENGDAWISLRREGSGGEPVRPNAGEPLGRSCLNVPRGGAHEGALFGIPRTRR